MGIVADGDTLPLGDPLPDALAHGDNESVARAVAIVAVGDTLPDTEPLPESLTLEESVTLGDPLDEWL